MRHRRKRILFGLLAAAVILAGVAGCSADGKKRLPEPGSLTYAEFCALSGTEKDAYMRSFPSDAEFYEWVVQAQEEFSKEHPETVLPESGVLDLSLLR